MNNHWVENPEYPVSDWQEDVANDDTRLGYAAWISAKRDETPELILHLEGGLIHNAFMSDGSPIPFAIEAHDYDTEGVEDADLEQDPDGQYYYSRRI